VAQFFCDFLEKSTNMEENKRYAGASATDAWQQFSTDITWQESPSNYRAIIHTGKYDVHLETIRSPGGGEEGWGFERTTLRAELPMQTGFRFEIVPEDFLNRIGKVFGMQDVQLGYPEFDKYVLVQTNDETKLKSIFADASTRELFMSLSGYSLHIDKHDGSEGDHLHLVLQHALVNQEDLQRVFNTFVRVLDTIS
jgi:hypothetical protein